MCWTRTPGDGAEAHGLRGGADGCVGVHSSTSAMLSLSRPQLLYQNSVGTHQLRAKQPDLSVIKSSFRAVQYIRHLGIPNPCNAEVSVTLSALVAISNTGDVVRHVPNLDDGRDTSNEVTRRVSEDR